MQLVLRMHLPWQDRQSVRLRSHDYKQPGAYFVTICARDRECLFGEFAGGVLRLNANAEIARDEWFVGARLRPYLRLNADEFVVMPNHVHGIVRLISTRDRRCHEEFGKPVAGSLSTIVRSYKAATTRRINLVRGTAGAPVWQRGFHDRILRDDAAVREIRRYIAENPLNGPP